MPSVLQKRTLVSSAGLAKARSWMWGIPRVLWLPVAELTDVSSRQSRSLGWAGLFGILAFAFWIGMNPHWDDPYPLHVDEWFAMGFAGATLDAGSLEYANPYARWQITFHQEMGFHLLLGFVKSVTGLSWMELYRVAPGVVSALLAFLVYAFGRRAGFGWAAALFIPLIPTSIRTLGPSFLVPVSVAMLFIPVTLLMLRESAGESRGKSLWILLLLIGGTLFVHPPTEGFVTALAVFYLGAFFFEALSRRQFAEGGRLLFAVGIRIAIPVLVIGLWLPKLATQALTQSISSDPARASRFFAEFGPNQGFLEAFGIFAVALAVLGLFALLARGELRTQSYILPILALALLAFQLVWYPRFQTGPVIFYERAWSYLGILLAILAGYGIAYYYRSIPAIASVVSARLAILNAAAIRTTLALVGAGVVLFVMTNALVGNEAREDYPRYYHLMNDTIAADFDWMGRHLGDDETVAIAEPGMAWAYPTIAGDGAAVLTAVASPWSNALADRLRLQLSTGQADVKWLRDREATVVYSCWPGTQSCQQFDAEGLLKVRRGVYLVALVPDEG